MPRYESAGGGGLSGLTTNRLIKAASATTGEDSLLSDDGTNVTLVSGAFRTPDWSTGAATIRGTTHATYGIGIDSAGLVNINADASGGGLQVGAASSGTKIFYGSATGFGISGSFTNAGGIFWNTNAVEPARVGAATDNGISLGSATWRWSSGYFGTSLFAYGPGVTSGSGTGLTVNVASELRRVVHKVTVTYAALAAAGLTADKTIATLPAKSRLVGILADTTTPYTGGGVTAATLIVGKTTGGNEYLVSHDVFTAAILVGDADADLGTSINRASAIQGGDLASWTGTTAISVRLTTVTANTDQLTAGSTTYYLITESMP